MDEEERRRKASMKVGGMGSYKDMGAGGDAGSGRASRAARSTFSRGKHWRDTDEEGADHRLLDHALDHDQSERRRANDQK